MSRTLMVERQSLIPALASTELLAFDQMQIEEFCNGELIVTSSARVLPEEQLGSKISAGQTLLTVSLRAKSAQLQVRLRRSLRGK